MIEVSQYMILCIYKHNTKQPLKEVGKITIIMSELERIKIIKFPPQ
jgi:hypothetical protein